MNLFQSCSNASDAVELCRPHGLYLKPVAKLNISVQLPVTKLPGKTISNWEVMEKLKHMIKPEEFAVLKVSKSTIEFIRFEGEIENKYKLHDVLKTLDMRTLKLTGFPELLKIRAAESKIEFPSRHTWDAYFRDAKHMNEMKPGERPDTLHISNLPCKWFSAKNRKGKQVGLSVSDKPDEYIFRKVFEKFGEIRFVDVPLCDPYRNMMKSHISGIKMFSFGQDHLFEGYVQYQEYMGFVKAMDALRGMKLLIKEGDKTFTAGIKVDFDKSKHLSDASIRRRKIERDKLMALERERDEKEKAMEELRAKQEEEERLAVEEAIRNKSERRKMREEKRKKKQLRKLHAKEAELMNKKIATEERKLLLAQRQLESIRLLDYLFERVKEKKQKEVLKKKEEAIGKKLSKVMKKKSKKEKKKELKDKLKKEKLESKEKKLRSKLVKKFETVQEQELEEQRERLRKTIEGKNKLKSVLAATCAQVSKHGATQHRASPPLLQPTAVADANINPQFQVVPGFSGIYPPTTGPQWYQTPNNPYGGYFEDVPGQYQPQPYFEYNFPNPNQGFQPRGGYFPRRGRGFWGPRRPRGFRRGGWNPSQYYTDMTNQEYYKYFKKLAGGGKNSRSHSHSRSRSRSRTRSRSRRQSRSHSRRRSRSRSRSRRNSHSRSRSRTRYKSRSSSRRRSRSRSRSKRRSRSRRRSGSRRKSRSKSCSKERSYSRSKSRSGRSRSKSRASRKRMRSRSPRRRNGTNARSKSKQSGGRDHSASRSKSPRNGGKQRQSKSRSQDRKPSDVHRTTDLVQRNSGSKSEAVAVPEKEPPQRQSSRSHSWSKSRSPRSRSWSQRQSRSRSRSKSLSKISSGTLSNDNSPRALENKVLISKR